MKKEHKELKGIKTTEMIDSFTKELDYNKAEEYKKRQDYLDEMENREPFERLFNAIERQNEEIQKLKKVVLGLVKHNHNTCGEVVIPIGQVYERFF